LQLIGTLALIRTAFGSSVRFEAHIRSKDVRVVHYELKMIPRRCVYVSAIAAGLVLLAGAAFAHPHVWVKFAAEIVYDADGSIASIRHAWTFDEMFTTYALQGIHTGTKGVYTREELAALAQTNIKSLKDNDYFTFAEADGKEQKLAGPIDYYFEYKDEALVLHFTLPFEAPLKTRQLTLEIFDPDYFIEFSSQEKEPIRLVGAPTACAMTIHSPTDEESTENLRRDNSSGNASNSFGAAFADKIRVDCP
jgi:ABC-type uncharacterized transport system substrate-binding protein